MPMLLDEATERMKNFDFGCVGTDHCSDASYEAMELVVRQYLKDSSVPCPTIAVTVDESVHILKHHPDPVLRGHIDNVLAELENLRHRFNEINPHLFADIIKVLETSRMVTFQTLSAHACHMPEQGMELTIKKADGINQDAKWVIERLTAFQEALFGKE